MSRHLLALVVGALLTWSCSRSVESCKKDARGLTQALCRELEHIECAQDLKERLPKVRRLYLELANLVIDVTDAYDYAECQPAHSEAESERLRKELIRIYEIAGVRELLEQAQEEAILALEKKFVQHLG